MFPSEQQLSEAERFNNWIYDNCEEGIRSKNASHKHEHFLPKCKLKDHFTEDLNHRLQKLLEMFDKDHGRLLVNDVLEDYIVVFSILHSLGEGTNILYFLRHNSLSDRNLPFKTPPADFPTAREDLFPRFYDKQWIFCPASFNFNKIGKEWERDRLIPITWKEPLKESQNSNTFKIKIHPDCYTKKTCRVSSTPSHKQEESYYVLKTYTPYYGDEQSSNEIEAFKHLRTIINSNTDGKGWNALIEHYCSFEHDGLFNIIIEYADGGNLQELFSSSDIDPPSRGQDIFEFWDGLLELLQGLHLIHSINIDARDSQRVLQGWHQDIKPENILIIHEEGSRRRFKLADLGLAHFRYCEGRQSLDRDTNGTTRYGAPESYVRNQSSARVPRQVGPTVDIWSLACVFSEALVWITGGTTEFQRYEQERFTETTPITNFDDKYAFHDLTKVLSSVQERHESLPRFVRAEDTTTSKVRDLVRFMLSFNRTVRPEANICLAQWEIWKKEAKANMGSFKCPPARTKSAPSNPNQDSLPTKKFSPSRGSSLEWKDENEPARRSLYLGGNRGNEKQAKLPVQSNSYELPEWTRQKAVEWLQDRQANRTTKIPMEYHGRELKGRDHYFLLDDSGPMREHWQKVRETVELFTEVIHHLGADNKLDIRCSINPDICSSPKPDKLLRFVNRHIPSSSGSESSRLSNLGRAVGLVLDEWTAKLRRPTLQQLFHSKTKPLSLYVLTDGCYQGKSDFKTPLHRIIKTLKEKGFDEDKHFIGIQFIRFGRDTEGARRLYELDTRQGDQGFGLEWDFIDVEDVDGNVWKCLLGSINATFDNDPRYVLSDATSPLQHRESSFEPHGISTPWGC